MSVFWNQRDTSYKVLTTTHPPCLHDFISVQPPRSTRCSSLVNLARPPISSSLRIIDRSFRYASPRLWNQLPIVLSVNLIPVPLSLTCLFMLLPHLLTLSTHHSHHPELPISFTLCSRPISFTNLYHHRLPSGLRTDSTDFTTRPFLLSISIFVFSFVITLFCLVPCGRFSWLFVRFWSHVVSYRIVSLFILTNCQRAIQSLHSTTVTY